MLRLLLVVHICYINSMNMYVVVKRRIVLALVAMVVTL